VLGAFGCFGRAPCEAGERDVGPDTLFSLFSVTKALTASAVWILLAEGRLALDQRVADWIPAFAAEGKQGITVEHLLTHTAGLPRAPFETLDWNDPERRWARFDSWRLEWPPGSRFVYHGSSGMWVLAELIGCAAGQDFRELIRARITGPLVLDLHLGLPASEHGRVARVVAVGEPASTAAAAPAPVDAPVIPDEMYETFNRADVQRVGNPGGGAIGTAAAVAMFYQAILADWRGDGPGIWSRPVLEDAFRVRFADFVDPMTKQPALRGLGVVTAGDSGAIWRGFSPHCSARSIGHMGAGGQIAWADPESGLSFAYVTNGAERDAVRQGGRGLRLSTLASECLA
jgi:CubicO group peptidase (beta-lactamase class C family)